MTTFRETLPYKLAMLLTVFPVMLSTITFDAFLHARKIRNPFLKRGIPRDVTELAQNLDLQREFFELLKSSEVCRGSGGGQIGDDGRCHKFQPLIPKEAIFVSVVVSDGTPMEPGKNRAVGRVDVTYRHPPQGCAMDVNKAGPAVTIKDVIPLGSDGMKPIREVTLHLFVKLASVRDWPVVFKALISTFTKATREHTVFTEIVPIFQTLTLLSPNAVKDRANELEASAAAATAKDKDGKPLPIPFTGVPYFPVAVPTCHFTHWSRFFDRSLAIYDCIDTNTWRAVPDSGMITEAHLLALVRSIAQFHSYTVGRVGAFPKIYHPKMFTIGNKKQTSVSAANEEDTPTSWRRFADRSSEIKCQLTRETCKLDQIVSPNLAVYRAFVALEFGHSPAAFIQSMLDAFKHRMVDKAVEAKFKKPSHKARVAEVLKGIPSDQMDLTAEEFAVLNDGSFFLRVWEGITKRLDSEVTCISHGDCRPGNKLFCGGGGGGTPDPTARPANTVANDRHPEHCDTSPAGFVMSRTPQEEDANGAKFSKETATVVHLDWEGCSLTPLLYDVAYIIGGRPERRRAEVVLLKAYLEALQTAVEARLNREGVTDASDRQFVLDLCVPSFESATLLMRIVYIMQTYFCWALGEFGGVGAPQGNAAADTERWIVRGFNTLSAATEDCEGMAAAIGNGVSAIDLKLLRYKMISTNMNVKVV